LEWRAIRENWVRAKGQIQSSVTLSVYQTIKEEEEEEEEEEKELEGNPNYIISL